MAKAQETLTHTLARMQEETLRALLDYREPIARATAWAKPRLVVKGALAVPLGTNRQSTEYGFVTAAISGGNTLWAGRVIVDHSARTPNKLEPLAGPLEIDVLADWLDCFGLAVGDTYPSTANKHPYRELGHILLWKDAVLTSLERNLPELPYGRSRS